MKGLDLGSSLFFVVRFWPEWAADSDVADVSSVRS